MAAEPDAVVEGGAADGGRRAGRSRSPVERERPEMVHVEPRRVPTTPFYTGGADGVSVAIQLPDTERVRGHLRVDFTRGDSEARTYAHGHADFNVIEGQREWKVSLERLCNGVSVSVHYDHIVSKRSNGSSSGDGGRRSDYTGGGGR